MNFCVGQSQFFVTVLFFHSGVHSGWLFCSSDIFYQYVKPMKAGTHAYKQSMDRWILTHGDMSYGRVSKTDQPPFLETRYCWRVGWQRRLGRSLLKVLDRLIVFVFIPVLQCCVTLRTQPLPAFPCL